MINLAKGSSYAFSVSRKSGGVSVDLSSYTCNLSVVAVGGEQKVSRAITSRTPDNLKFLINLTPTETASLTVGAEYIVAYRLSDVASSYVRESSFNIKIIESYFD